MIRETRWSTVTTQKRLQLRLSFSGLEDGKRKIVFPASIAEAKIQLPPGLKSLK